MDGRLVTYFCPTDYCKCVSDGDLPGCVFNPDRIDDQCDHNRTGVLCGQCQRGLSVGLRSVKQSVNLTLSHKSVYAFRISPHI